MIEQKRDKAQVVAAILHRGGRFLVGKRSPNKRSAPLYWCPVCGGVDPGETSAQAVEREVREESGLLVRARHEVARCETDDGQALIHWWIVDCIDDHAEEMLGDEHTELRWVTLDEFRRLTPVFDADVEIFVQAQQWLEQASALRP